MPDIKKKKKKTSRKKTKKKNHWNFFQKKGKKKKSNKKRRKSTRKSKWQKKLDAFYQNHSYLIQMVCVILALSVTLAAGKYYFFGISKEQAERIRIAESELAGEDGILEAQQSQEETVGRPEITQHFLTVNPYSRSGISIGRVRGIVVHYVANPGSSAEENRSYFEGLKDNHVRKASSHYVIGLDGEIVQCIPLDEISYASNQRNKDTIAIECCHPDDSGQFSQKTYESLVRLVSWLCYTYGLSKEDVIRHYDVTGKMCPLYYVEHEEDWRAFQDSVDEQLP